MSKAKKNNAAKPISNVVYQIIRTPVITEKSTAQSEFNKVTFKVKADADKDSIKKAVEALFEVKVTKVNTLNQAGKAKRFRGNPGVRAGFKKAVVTLAEGQTIDVMGGIK